MGKLKGQIFLIYEESCLLWRKINGCIGFYLGVDGCPPKGHDFVYAFNNFLTPLILIFLNIIVRQLKICEMVGVFCTAERLL